MKGWLTSSTDSPSARGAKAQLQSATWKYATFIHLWEMLRKRSFEVVYKTGVHMPILSHSWLQDLSNNSNQQMGAPGHPFQRQHQLKRAQQNPVYAQLQDAAFNLMNFSIYDFCHADFLPYPVMALPAELFGFAFQICLGLSRKQNTCNYHLSSNVCYFNNCSQLRLRH